MPGRMKWNFVYVFAAYLFIAANSCYAVGFGKVSLYSYLNEPLSAEIELLGVENIDQYQLQINLASPKDFVRASIARPFYLTKLKFEIVRNEDQTLAYISTPNSISHPFLDFLVELSWPNGRIVKAYTLLIDPAPAGKSYTKRPEPLIKRMTISKTEDSFRGDASNYQQSELKDTKLNAAPDVDEVDEPEADTDISSAPDAAKLAAENKLTEQYGDWAAKSSPLVAQMQSAPVESKPTKPITSKLELPKAVTPPKPVMPPKSTPTVTKTPVADEQLFEQQPPVVNINDLAANNADKNKIVTTTQQPKKPATQPSTVAVTTIETKKVSTAISPGSDKPAANQPVAGKTAASKPAMEKPIQAAAAKPSTPTTNLEPAVTVAEQDITVMDIESALPLANTKPEQTAISKAAATNETAEENNLLSKYSMELLYTLLAVLAVSLLAVKFLRRNTATAETGTTAPDLDLDYDNDDYKTPVIKKSAVASKATEQKFADNAMDFAVSLEIADDENSLADIAKEIETMGLGEDPTLVDEVVQAIESDAELTFTKTKSTVDIQPDVSNESSSEVDAISIYDYANVDASEYLTDKPVAESLATAKTEAPVVAMDLESQTTHAATSPAENATELPTFDFEVAANITAQPESSARMSPLELRKEAQKVAAELADVFKLASEGTKLENEPDAKSALDLGMGVEEISLEVLPSTESSDIKSQSYIDAEMLTTDLGVVETNAALPSIDIDDSEITATFDLLSTGMDENELAVKFNLAKKYVEAGDVASAKEILEEIIASVDPTYLEQAKELMSKL